MSQQRPRPFFSLFLVGVLASLLLAACSASAPATPAASAPAPDKLRVGMVIVGTAADGGWNSAAADGLRQLRDTHGVEIDYKEVQHHENWDKAPPADWAAALSAYAEQGYPLVFAHGRFFDQTVAQIASNHPNTRFVITGGNVSGPNYASVTLKNEEGGYLLGVLAGSMTQSKVIGTIAGSRLRPVLATVEGFKAGVQTVNPEVKIIERVLADPTPGTGMNSPEGANAEAEELVAQGADIIFAHATAANVGIINIAKQHNVQVVNYAKDLTALAPETVLANGVQFIPATMLRMFEIYRDGKFEGKIYNMGLSEDAVRLSPLRDNMIPSDVQARVDLARQELIGGRIALEIKR